MKFRSFVEAGSVHVEFEIELNYKLTMFKQNGVKNLRLESLNPEFKTVFSADDKRIPKIFRDDISRVSGNKIEYILQGIETPEQILDLYMNFVDYLNDEFNRRQKAYITNMEDARRHINELEDASEKMALGLTELISQRSDK